MRVATVPAVVSDCWGGSAAGWDISLREEDVLRAEDVRLPRLSFRADPPGDHTGEGANSADANRFHTTAFRLRPLLADICQNGIDLVPPPGHGLGRSFGHFCQDANLGLKNPQGLLLQQLHRWRRSGPWLLVLLLRHEVPPIEGDK
jgi:hypothetical protein